MRGDQARHNLDPLIGVIMKKILVVDDEHLLGRLITRSLTNEGYEAQYIHRASIAIDMELDEFDLVLTDYNMPEINGSRFCELANQFFPKLPIIMMTGSDVELDLPNIKHIINKPFEMDNMLKLINDVI